MKKATTLAGVLTVIGAAGLSLAAVQAPPDQGPQRGAEGAATLNKQDTDFFQSAAQGNLLEVKLGELAAKQAASEDVRKFGQRMVDDHGKLNRELSQIAQQKKGVTMPQQLDKKHQNEVNKLAQHSGAKFDHEYMSRISDEHQKEIKAYEKQVKDAKDPDLKQYASNALPSLQEHLALAKDVKSRIKK